MSTNINADTNGYRKKLITRLESEVRDAIDATYLTGERYPNGARKTHDTDDARAIRDYVRGQSWTDKFDDMIDREMSHERRHQRGRPASVQAPRLSTRHRALIVMLHNIGNGSTLDTMPPASMFINCRDTAAEAQLLGYLARIELRKRPELLTALDALDYAGAVRV